MDINKFSGCTAISCVRQLDTRMPRVRANYLIEETCRYAKLGVCTHGQERNRYNRNKREK